jgi:hypothetical protein
MRKLCTSCKLFYTIYGFIKLVLAAKYGPIALKRIYFKSIGYCFAAAFPPGCAAAQVFTGSFNKRIQGFAKAAFVMVKL